MWTVRKVSAGPRRCRSTRGRATRSERLRVQESWQDSTDAVPATVPGPPRSEILLARAQNPGAILGSSIRAGTQNAYPSSPSKPTRGEGRGAPWTGGGGAAAWWAGSGARGLRCGGCSTARPVSQHVDERRGRDEAVLANHRRDSPSGQTPHRGPRRCRLDKMMLRPPPKPSQTCVAVCARCAKRITTDEDPLTPWP